MRWLFLDPDRKPDVARRERFVRLIDKWWSDFAEESPALLDVLDLPEAQVHAERLQEGLARIDDRLCWEIGPGAAGKPHRLVITPETDVDLRPLTATLLERAPDLPGWEFYSHRLAESAELLPFTLEHRVGRVPGSLRVFVEPAGARKLALRLASPDFEETGTEEPTELDCAAAFVAAETLLGEEFVDQWIGYVGVEPTPIENRGTFEILFGRRPPFEGLAPDQVRATCWSAATSLRDLSPDRSFLERAAEGKASGGLNGMSEWIAVHAEPYPDALAPREGSPGTAEWASDVERARVVDPELWAAFREPMFFSASWSRAGETFCRLQLSPAGGAALPLGRLVEELNQTLAPGALGCAIGAAQGRRFGHIDLALVSLPRAVEALRRWGRRTVQAERLAPASWLLFHDAYLSGEWVGLADDSPAPPGME